MIKRSPHDFLLRYVKQYNDTSRGMCARARAPDDNSPRIISPREKSDHSERVELPRLFAAATWKATLRLDAGLGVPADYAHD